MVYLHKQNLAISANQSHWLTFVTMQWDLHVTSATLKFQKMVQSNEIEKNFPDARLARG